jgi:hypothetical protein
VGTVRPNRKVMTVSIRQEMKLKQGDIQTRMSCKSVATMWKDKL